MKRIAIIGSCGAGKSTLSKALGKKLNLPVIHLDAYYWQSGWQETDRDRWQQIQQDLIKGECWIIDGNYGNSLELRLLAADTIIFLDFNRYLCIWRIFKRYTQYAGKTRPDMAIGCPERINWEFLSYVWNFPKSQRSNILLKLAQFREKKQIITLQDPDRVFNFLQQI